MKNKGLFSVILVIMLILGASSVLADDAFDIVEANIDLTGNAGTLSDSFTINNTGTTNLTISFSQYTLTSGSGDSIDVSSIDNVDVKVGTQQVVNFDVDISAAKVGDYTGDLLASAGGVSDTITINVNVTPNGGGLSFPTGTLTDNTQSGETVERSFDITSDKNEDVNINSVAIEIDSFTNADVDESSSIVEAFGSTTVTYTVVVPGNQESGTYNGNITINTDAGNAVVPIRVIVQDTEKISLTPSTLSLKEDAGDSTDGTLTISNTGNVNITGLSISYDSTDFTDNDGDVIEISFSRSSEINVSVGDQKKITVTADLPDDIDPDDYVGTVTVSKAGLVETFTLNVTVENFLKIKEVDVSSYKSDKFKPGETIEVTVEYENNADEIDLEDVELIVQILDEDGDVVEDDDGDDIEDDEDIGDLDAGDDGSTTFEFTMPYDVDDGDEYTVYAKIKGDNVDDNSEKYEDVDDSETIKAVRENHEIELYDVELDSETLSCGRVTYLHVSVRDIGSSDEDVELLVENYQLGISNTDIFEVDSDPDKDDFEVTRSYLIDIPDDTTPGTYQLNIKAYYDDGDELEATTVVLTVEQCGAGTTTGTTTTDTGTTTTGTTDQTIDVQYTTGTGEITTTPGVSATPPTLIKKKSDFGASTALVLILVLANLIIIGGIIALVAKLVIRK